MQEVSTVAAMSQCLVDRFNTLIDRGYTLPVTRGWIVREVVAAGGTPMDVVDSLVEELRSDRFSPLPNPTLP